MVQKPVKIIAEIGINHNGSLKNALRMVRMAADSGADIIKFQTVNADVVYKKNDPLYEIFKRVELDVDDWKTIKVEVERCGKEFMSTPGDRGSLNFLCRLGVNRLKIASDSAQNTKFVNYALSKKKPLIVSMGMLSSVSDIWELIVKYDRCPDVIFHCVSKYPTPNEEAGLCRIKELVERNKNPSLEIGYSDHVRGYGASLVAVSIGARYIEKHVKLTDEDIDAPVSLSFGEFSEMVRAIRQMEEFL